MGWAGARSCECERTYGARSGRSPPSGVAGPSFARRMIRPVASGSLHPRTEGRALPGAVTGREGETYSETDDARRTASQLLDRLGVFPMMPGSVHRASKAQPGLRPLRGPFTRWPRVSDALVAVVVCLWSVFVSLDDPGRDIALRSVDEVEFATLVVSVVAGGALYWRRRRPLIVLGVTIGATIVATVVSDPDAVGFAMLFALYGVGRHVADTRSSYAGVTAVVTLAAISTVAQQEPLANIGAGMIFVAAIWYVGRRVRLRGVHLTLLQERAAQLEREQEETAVRAAAEERTRIARELHDVVAHRVTLMTVQAGAAKTVAADDPEAAVRAMGAVEQAGRQALGELRHLLGVLRPHAAAETTAPQPGLADIPHLVDQFRESGLAVSFSVDGQPVDLPAPLDLSIYRIVQEALTNVVKHAGPDAVADVGIRVEGEHVVIEVSDDGLARAGMSGSGHGLVGMRERAHLLGGSLQAGPLPLGGFRVVARVPIGDTTP